MAQDVAYWHFATFRWAAELGRYQSRADMAQLAAGSTRSRMTQKINAPRQLRRPCVACPLGVSTQPRPIAVISGQRTSDLLQSAKNIGSLGNWHFSTAPN